MLGDSAVGHENQIPGLHNDLTMPHPARHETSPTGPKRNDALTYFELKNEVDSTG